MHPRPTPCRPGLVLVAALACALGGASPSALAQAPPDAGSATAATGQTRGIMVRLETTSASIGGDPRVALTPVGGGPPIELALLDDGNSPDVAAGDGIYAGTSMVQGDGFDVTLTVGEQRFDGGEVSWGADAGSARDLVIRLVGDEIAVVAAQPVGGGAPGRDAAPTDAAPTAAVGRPVAATPASASTTRSTIRRDDALLWLAIGLGLVVLAGAGLVVSRWMRGGGDARPDPMDEPGLFGPGTPSLTDAPAWWVLGRDDADGLRAALLHSVARHHRVLIVSASGVTTPRVIGGPAYHIGWDADAAEDAAYALVDRGGPRLVAVLWSPDARPETVRPLLDVLPDGVGALIVSEAVPDTPGAVVVHLQRHGDGAVLDTPNGPVALRTIGTAREALGRS